MTNAKTYQIEQSQNGTILDTNLDVVKFTTIKEAREYANHIIKCASLYNYSWEVGSYFVVVDVVYNESWEENEYIQVGNKIIVKKEVTEEF